MDTYTINRKMKKVTIMDPCGNIGTWFSPNSSMLEAGIIELKKLMKSDNQGYSIDIKDCEPCIPDNFNIFLFDKDLQYIGIEDCIIKIQGNKITKNRTVFSRIVCECARNSAYYAFVNSAAEKSNNEYIMDVMVEINKTLDMMGMDISTIDMPPKEF